MYKRRLEFNGTQMKHFDVIIIGAGAAGLSAAGAAIANKKSVAVIDMGHEPARKVMASGGGKCNITNTDAKYTRYFGENPNFVRGALSRVSPNDILAWANEHNIELYQKTPGRYFCVNGAKDVTDALMQDANGAHFVFDTYVSGVSKNGDMFIINSPNKTYQAKSLIVATGGTSFATLGVSDMGCKIAKSFGHKIIPMRPALCALAISGAKSELAGISINAEIKIGKVKIQDDLLFTHFGIGGPLAYRASLCDMSKEIIINMAPNIDVGQMMRDAKRQCGKKNIASVLANILPMRIAKLIAGDKQRNIADIKDREIDIIANNVNNIVIDKSKIKPHGLSSAEVVRGGVATDDISSKTMESKLCPGLFFAGEVMDIAGDLGGFNLQWAWASGRVAGQNA